MKIAYLANVRFPSERAHAVQIFHMCKAFSDNGADLTLFVNKIGQKGTASPQEYFKTECNFKIKRLSRGPFLPRFKPSYYFGEFLFSLSFLLSDKSSSFDIVYSRHEWIVWMLSFFIPTQKLVWESHEAKFNIPARRILKKGIKAVVISGGILDFYKNGGVPEQQMLIAHDGIDETFFGEVESKSEAGSRLGLSQDARIVMYIGGFDAWKGVETFFKASKLLPDITFVAIGGRSEEVASFSLKYPNVIFLGQRPYSELKDNQQAADILVVPNTAQNELSEKFTSPLKLFAHMASGVPLILSDVSSLTSVAGRDLVTIFTPDDAESLKEAVLRVFADYDQMSTFAQELKAVSLGYTWDKRAVEIMDLNTVR